LLRAVDEWTIHPLEAEATAGGTHRQELDSEQRQRREQTTCFGREAEPQASERDAIWDFSRVDWHGGLDPTGGLRQGWRERKEGVFLYQDSAIQGCSWFAVVFLNTLVGFMIAVMEVLQMLRFVMQS
jgi:hypothetical protein